MESKKQKILKILKRIGIGLSLGFNVLFLIAFIIGSSGNKKQVNNSGAINESNIINEVVRNKPQPRYISYNDETRYVTFDSYELNNYRFDNFYNALDDNTNYINYISYNNSELDYDDTLTEGGKTYISYTYNGLIINFGYGSIFSSFGNDYPCFEIYSGDTKLSFEYSLMFEFSASSYATIKSAIELDILSNQSNINDGIFETLTDSVVAFVGSIGSGISSMVAVFYDSANSQLTTIGLLSVIVVAVSLAYFLFRLIIGLIRMRG